MNLFSAVTVFHVGSFGLFFSETSGSLKAREDLIVYTAQFILRMLRHFKRVALFFGMLFMERLAFWHEIKR